MKDDALTVALLRLSVNSGLIRGSATDFHFPRKPNPPKFRPFHQASLTPSRCTYDSN